MIDFDKRELPVSVQVSLLGINRTSLYYKPVLPDEHDLFIKREIDEIYTQHPDFGYRRIAVWLKKYRQLTINKKTVLKHMREMGIQAIYPRQNTSKSKPGKPFYKPKIYKFVS